MLEIEQPDQTQGGAWLNLGFRPFFTVAILYAIVAVSIWLAIYVLHMEVVPMAMPALTWHAHEMIYGYSLAVIAGFLLTAVKNWTGYQTVHGLPLLFIVALWLMVRLNFLAYGLLPVPVLAMLETVFIGLLFVAVAIPVFIRKQWRQMGLLSKLFLFLPANIIFYLGAAGVMEDGVRIGLYAGLYLVMAILFNMARRVVPFFIEKAVGSGARIYNWLWLDMSSLAAFLLFAVFDLFTPWTEATASLAGFLFVVHAVRLWGWHTPALWRHPLLWVLFLGYAWIVSGFALEFLSVFAGVSPFLSIHAFAYGGIGVMTIGMMARVTLGHTGRSVFEPPPVLWWIFPLMVAGAIMRVVMPVLVEDYYEVWIGISQALWILAFTAFAFVYLPMLVRPRVDGEWG